MVLSPASTSLNRVEQHPSLRPDAFELWILWPQWLSRWNLTIKFLETATVYDYVYIKMLHVSSYLYFHCFYFFTPAEDSKFNLINGLSKAKDMLRMWRIICQRMHEALTTEWKSRVLYENIDFLYPWVICGTHSLIHFQSSICLFFFFKQVMI